MNKKDSYIVRIRDKRRITLPVEYKEGDLVEIKRVTISSENKEDTLEELNDQLRIAMEKERNEFLELVNQVKSLTERLNGLEKGIEKKKEKNTT